MCVCLYWDLFWVSSDILLLLSLIDEWKSLWHMFILCLYELQFYLFKKLLLTIMLLFSAAKLYPTLWDSMNFSTPGFPALHYLCPSLSLRAWLNSYPLSQWCHPTISFSVIPFSSCPQSSPASGSFPVSQLFSSGGQSTEASTQSSFLPMNKYLEFISFRIDRFDLLAVQGTLKSLLQH